MPSSIGWPDRLAADDDHLGLQLVALPFENSLIRRPAAPGPSENAYRSGPDLGGESLWRNFWP